MQRPERSAPARPLVWQPLVSPSQWAVLRRRLGDAPEALSDLRVILTQLSPGVRRTLLDNLIKALACEERPLRAVWTAMALTGHEVKLGSAAALARLHALGDDLPTPAPSRLGPTA